MLPAHWLYCNNFYFTQNKNYYNLGYNKGVSKTPTNTKYSLGQAANFNVKAITGLSDSILKSLTVNNFIVEITSIPATGGTTGSEAGTICWTYAASGCNISKHYNNSTYVFSVSGLNQSVSLSGRHAIEGYSHGAYGKTQTFQYNVYLVL